MGVSKTTNGGVSWSRYNLTDTTGFTYALAIDPTNSNIIYAGGNPGLYKSTNSGTSWIYSSSGIIGYVYTIAINPNTSSTLFAGTPNGVFKSTNSGVNWTDMGLTNVKTIIVDPSASNAIYAGTGDGVYKSSSGGGNWIRMNQGLLDSSITSLGIHTNNYLFVGTRSAGVFRWQLAGIHEEDNVFSKSTFFYQSNPSRGQIMINYSLPRRTTVKLTIYDVHGRLVKNLISEIQEPGVHIVFWNGLDTKNRSVSAGVYFIKLLKAKTNLVKKLILLR